MNKYKALQYVKILLIVYLVLTSFYTIRDLSKSGNGNYVDEVCSLKSGDCAEDPRDTSVVKIIKGDEKCRCVDWTMKIVPLDQKLKQNYGINVILVSALLSAFIYGMMKKEL